MKLRLVPSAQRDLRAYGYHVAADDPEAAEREMDKVLDAIRHFSDLPADGRRACIRGIARTVRKWYLHPFHVY